MEFTEEAYDGMIAGLFRRFPSFQKVGAGAYKPGIDNMMMFDSLLGHPHRKYRTIHVAGTNGKGSVSNMLASSLAACGLKVGLYTSPHILDFRERMRVVCPEVSDSPKTLPASWGPPFSGAMFSPSQNASGQEGGKSAMYISKEEVWDFVQEWGETFDHLDLSFFEITTAMAFCWFARQEVDVAVVETGLGGRLDSTNIITPELSVITNIGLDHCDMLGNTLAEIAFEKAGIIKPCVPVVIGESNPETDPVFERKVLYTNLPESSFAGDRTRIMGLLTFADKTGPMLWERHEEILGTMDLQGVYQKRNLRTVLAALDVLRARVTPGMTNGGDSGEKMETGITPGMAKGGDKVLNGESADAHSRLGLESTDGIVEAIVNTARRMDFHGRWEKLCDAPYTICDIGHNAHGLKYNFAQLEDMMRGGRFRELIMVYGSVADKDVEAVLRMFPEGAHYIFTNAEGKRALPADGLAERYKAVCGEIGREPGDVLVVPSVGEAVERAAGLAGNLSTDGSASDVLVYIGGSTYVVSEATAVWSFRVKHGISKK